MREREILILATALLVVLAIVLSLIRSPQPQFSLVIQNIGESFDYKIVGLGNTTAVVYDKSGNIIYRGDETGALGYIGRGGVVVVEGTFVTNPSATTAVNTVLKIRSLGYISISVINTSANVESVEPYTYISIINSSATLGGWFLTINSTNSTIYTGLVDAENLYIANSSFVGGARIWGGSVYIANSSMGELLGEARSLLRIVNSSLTRLNIVARGLISLINTSYLNTSLLYLEGSVYVWNISQAKYYITYIVNTSPQPATTSTAVVLSKPPGNAIIKSVSAQLINASTNISSISIYVSDQSITVNISFTAPPTGGEILTLVLRVEIT